jgi:hypothetical protein
VLIPGLSCKKSNDVTTDDTVIVNTNRTVGLFLNNTAKVFNGYTLFAPKQNTMTYLINNEGKIMHQWTKSIYPPGQSVYLLENGNLLRTCMSKGKLSSGGGEGGRVEEYDWDGNLVWQLDFSTETYMQHHDIRQLPNGNILMLVIEKKTLAECLAGGKRGKGGDLLYRWGNPLTYKSGTASDQRYFQQHDVEWVRTGYPGAGNISCFNNGLGRGDYSTVDEFTPAVDASGNYPVSTGTAWSPATYTWTYKGTTADPMYSENISGAHRLPNGNTIICSGTVGLFLEVTSTGEIVWKYICPVQGTGPIKQGTKPDVDAARTAETMNSVFRVYKYPVTYSAFSGKALTAGAVIEL